MRRRLSAGMAPCCLAWCQMVHHALPKLAESGNIAGMRPCKDRGYGTCGISGVQQPSCSGRPHRSMRLRKVRLDACWHNADSKSHGTPSCNASSTVAQIWVHLYT